MKIFETKTIVVAVVMMVMFGGCETKTTQEEQTNNIGVQNPTTQTTDDSSNSDEDVSDGSTTTTDDNTGTNGDSNDDSTSGGNNGGVTTTTTTDTSNDSDDDTSTSSTDNENDDNTVTGGETTDSDGGETDTNTSTGGGNDDTTTSGTDDNTTTGSNDDNTTTSVETKDLTPPVVTLNGDANITLTLGENYEELGATATDDVDGTVSVVISGDVNTSKVGVYTITYTATDVAGNSVSVIRTVNVKRNELIPKSLLLTTPKAKIIRTFNRYLDKYQPVGLTIKVMGVYGDGHEEEVTDQVTLHHASPSMEKDYYVYAKDAGTYTFDVSLDKIVSNQVSVEIENNKEMLQYKISHSLGGIYLQVEFFEKPTHDVNLTFTIAKEAKAGFPTHVNKGITQSQTITFTPNMWNGEDAVVGAIRIEYRDLSLTEPITLITEAMKSEDTKYNNVNLEDLVLNRMSDFQIDTPSLQERKGAIRGVSIKFAVWSEYARKEYTLVNPPKGMKITGSANEGMEGRTGVEIQWDVPMDAIEGKIYDITVHVKERGGRENTATFPIKVPKTKPIQTKLVNNELTVTDKNSNLYGMKMKGHNGEDISELRLRSVEYGDVWKHYPDEYERSKKFNNIPFIIENKPSKLDIGFSDDLYLGFYRYDKWRIFLLSEPWNDITRGYIRQSDGTYRIDRSDEYDNGGTKVYLMTIENKGI